MRIVLFANLVFLLGIMSTAYAMPLMSRNTHEVQPTQSTDVESTTGSMTTSLNSSDNTAVNGSPSLRSRDPDGWMDSEPRLIPRGKVNLKVSFDFGEKTSRPTAAQQSIRGSVTRFLTDAMRNLINNVEFNIEFENDWIGANTEITFAVVGGQQCPADESGAAASERRAVGRESEFTMSKRSGSGCRGGTLDKGAKTWVLKNPSDRPIYGPVPRPKSG
ncbi:hypothetical protein EV361DRAFT_880595 [Lentinula raphanica]|uniref:Uncharacterized protein n=1 Tax=Lentinula raphanica TaxID=153919 RepID=A0AA38UM78_9AGAR|nr:hypothetical protein C8R42DRAFT_651057 [Lentinula raphanica]KAJ3843842.1 hypothetical protein F5878DRAFT_603693 [Lentinula raphanica]KAJ3977127.1 hypothetical protein EV361DRAFT_880595 [Lentinula raphanica]